MMNRWKEKMMQFMAGRYGADQFNRFLMFVTMGCIIFAIFTRKNIFYYLAVLLLVYSYYRILSKNHGKRYEENQKYLRYETIVRNTWQARKNNMAQRKTHHIYRCPKCRQKIRVPKGKGKIAITCPNCHTEFIRKS
ncbi:MAG: hypothetical protein PHE02_14020 [Lachnospiraceae bacterium]|nr:hypothetical protein [Lachnospiraceae bacterium]